jgi:4-carboxymuconolactone decarboxylase
MWTPRARRCTLPVATLRKQRQKHRHKQEENAMPATPSFGRYAELTLDEMTAEQKQAYSYLIDGPRGRLPGPYKIWIHNPKLVHAADPLGRHFTPGNYSLSEREREIAVVVITTMWNSDYPAAAHEKRGKEVGLPAAAVEAITTGLPASFDDPREQVVYEVAISLANNRIVSQGLHDRAVSLLGHHGVSDVITLIGYYTAVSLTMNFYAVPAGSPGLTR